MSEHQGDTDGEATRNPFESYHYFYDQQGNDWGWFYESDLEVAEITEEEEEKA